MSTYETLSLMIAFGVLIVMITGTKIAAQPTKFNDYFYNSYSLEATHWSVLPFCTFIINSIPVLLSIMIFSIYYMS